MKLTKEEFIRRARLIHGEKYDYSKVVYTNYHAKVIIVCKKCGNEFEQQPANHLNGKGCRKCAHEYVLSFHKLTKGKFIKRAEKVHGQGRYCYDDVEYIDSTTKVKISCPIHGSFMQTPDSHLQGHGCPVCAGKERWTKEKLIREGVKKFGDRYDYSKADVKDKYKVVEIKCNVCGTVFFAAPCCHVKNPQGGCPSCRYKHAAFAERVKFDEFENRCREVHGNRYSYLEDSFTDMRNPVGILCPKHGLFYQHPHVHLKGCGCPLCSNEKISKQQTFTQEQFVKKCKETHGDKYDYTNSVYTSSYDKVEIVCPTHGSFWQSPANHWKGEGCPSCNRKSKGEEKIAEYLKKRNLDFERQHRIQDVKVKVKTYMLVDCYIPEKKIIIEFNGAQHYAPVDFFGGTESFKKQQQRDCALRNYCKEKRIKLIEIPYWELNNIETILDNEI